MDSTVHFTSVRNAGFVMDAANKMRLESDMCDIILVVDNLRIQAHGIILAASAPYFHQMLKKRPITPHRCEYQLDGVEASAALQIIEFCYTSTISVSEESATAIFTAAAKLGCMEVVDLCCQMLTSGLDITTCVETHLMAASLGCRDLMATTGSFLIDNMDKLCVNDTFLGLSPPDMSSFVSSLWSLDADEVLLFTCTKAWFDHVTEDRRPLVLQFNEECSTLTPYLKKYLDVVLPLDSPCSVLTNDHSDRDRGIQLADREIVSREKTAVSLASSCRSNSSRQHGQLQELPVNVCVTCDQFCDGQCQPSRCTQECSQTITPSDGQHPSRHTQECSQSATPCDGQHPSRHTQECSQTATPCDGQHPSRHTQECSQSATSSDGQLPSRHTQECSQTTTPSDGQHPSRHTQECSQTTTPCDSHYPSRHTQECCQTATPCDGQHSSRRTQECSQTATPYDSQHPSRPTQECSQTATPYDSQHPSRHTQECSQATNPCDSHQSSQHTDECCQTAIEENAVRSHFTNQTNDSLHRNFHWPTDGASSHEKSLKKYSPCGSFNDCDNDVICGRQLEHENRRYSSETNIKWQTPVLHSNTHRQKCTLGNPPNEALKLNEQNGGIIAKKNISVSVQQLSTANTVHKYSKSLPVAKWDSSHGFQKGTLKKHNRALQRKEFGLPSSPGTTINKQRLFTKDQHNSSLSHKQLKNSNTLTEVPAKSVRNNANFGGTCYKTRGIDFEKNETDSHTVNSSSHQIYSTSNRTGFKCNVSESSHACTDSHCSQFKYSIDSPVNEELNCEKFCLGEDLKFNGRVSVDNLETHSTLAGKNEASNFITIEEMPHTFLAQDLSNSKCLTAARCGSKFHLWKCKACHWAFMDRAQLVKHRHAVHGAMSDLLDEEDNCVTGDSFRRPGNCEKKGLTKINDITEKNSETSTAENSCRSTSRPSAQCRSGKNATDSQRPSSSKYGDRDENTISCGLCLTKATLSPRPTFPHCDPSPHKNKKSSDCTSSAIQCVGATTNASETANSCIDNVDMPLHMSTTTVSRISNILHGTRHLSDCYTNKTLSATDDCYRVRSCSNTYIADSEAKATSLNSSSEFIFDFSSRHGAPLSSSLNTSFKLPSDFLLTNISENDRKIRTAPTRLPESTSYTPKGCSGGANSMSDKGNFTSDHDCTLASPNGLAPYRKPCLTHRESHNQSSTADQSQSRHQHFTNPSDHKVHKCMQEINKPFTCPHCHHTFAKNMHLKRHLATHSGLKPYPCWVCGKRFSRSDHLRRHTQSLHAGSKPHGCQMCGKQFVRKYELSKHMTAHSVYMNG